MGGQQQKQIPAQNYGEAYQEIKPYQIAQLEICLDNGNFLKVENSLQPGKLYQYTLKSSQSSQIEFGLSMPPAGQDLNGPVQIYMIDNPKKKNNKSQNDLLCFEGELQRGKRNGFGIQYSNEEPVYRGFFKNNKYHGWGISHNYEGQWVQGVKCGFGKYRSDGKKKITYEGNWKNNRFDGLGAKNIALSESDNFVLQKYTASKVHLIDEQYIGQWLEGVKYGCGKSIKYIQSSDRIQRQVYEGEFIKNLYHGRGRLVTREGKVQKGNFELGTFKEPSS